jgi:serine/threonine protein kinase
VTEPFTSRLTSPQHPTETERAGPGTVVGGRYALLAAVGHGGMGTVWQATDTQLGRSVAVKEVVPPPGIAPDDREAMYQRMLREARAAASLSHPAIVQVYDVVTDAGRPWVVMELLEARSLSELVLQDGPLAPRAVAKIGVALLGALEVAHAAGVLHRDVKPANVLICTDGRCVLTDFGVARMPSDQQLTTPGMVLGSPHFISPERAMGAAFGPPSDLFSVGVTLYAAVEGRPPFDKGEPIATMHSVVEDEPPPPERAGPLTEVLYGLLDKDPQRRWDTAAARSNLRELLAGPLATRTPQFPTDPYAVVPTQRQPWQPSATSGATRIGGRALLAPGESPVERAAPAPTDSTVVLPRSAVDEQADPYAELADPYGRATDTYRGARAHGSPAHGSPAHGSPAHGSPAHGSPAHGSSGYGSPAHGSSGYGADGYGTDAYGSAGYGAAGYRTEAYGAPAPGGRRPARRRGAAAPGVTSRARELAGRAATTLGHTGGRALTAARQAPRPVQLAAAGLVAVVLLATVWLATTGGEEPADVAGGQVPAPDASAAPPADTPLLDEVQEYAGRGLVVNLPAGWAGVDNPDLVYVDFVDRADASTQVRLLREETGASEPRRFVEVAEENIASSTGCADPYERVALTDFELVGQPAALLEYTCGAGDQMRRAKWATVIQDGFAYSFRLTALEPAFAEQAVVFDELVRSFRLTG